MWAEMSAQELLVVAVSVLFAGLGALWREHMKLSRQERDCHAELLALKAKFDQQHETVSKLDSLSRSGPQAIIPPKS